MKEFFVKNLFMQFLFLVFLSDVAFSTDLKQLSEMIEPFLLKT